MPLSIAVVTALYARKLKKVRDRRRKVVITQYGIHGMLERTEMRGVGEGTRCDNQDLMVPRAYRLLKEKRACR